MDIRKIVSAYISKAIDGSINYSGEDKETNQQIWINLATDRIMGSLLACLPEPVDIESKYELDSHRGLLTKLDPHNTDFNDAQLEQLSHYASDQGYNTYRYQVEYLLTKPYNLQQQNKSATIQEGENNGK